MLINEIWGQGDGFCIVILFIFYGFVAKVEGTINRIQNFFTNKIKNDGWNCKAQN